MKRILAAGLLICLLLTMAPTVFAEPMEIIEPAAVEEAEQDGQEEAPAEEETDEQPGEPEAEAEEAEAQPEEIDPLAGETAIRRAEITGIVDEKGGAVISVKLQMQVVGVEETLRFAVPENSKNREIGGYRSKSVTEDGQPYLTISSDAGFTGEQTFTLSYTLSGLVSKGEESQKLELPLLAAQDYRVGQVALAVNLPKTFSSFPSFSSGYYGEIIEDYMDYETTAQAVAGTVNVILQDSDTLQMALTVPEDYFSGGKREGVMPKMLTAAVIVLLGLTALYWWRTMRSAPLRVQARTLPPDGVNPGDLPYLLAGENADFHMLVSHWATLGYLSFYVNKAGHVILRRRMSMGNERRAYERKLFDLLFGSDNLCDGASYRYKKVGERAMAVLPRYWGRRLFDKHSGSPALVRLLCCLACAVATLVAMDSAAPEKLHGLFLVVGFVAGTALCWILFGIFGHYYLRSWVKLGISACSGLLLLILGGLGGVALTMAPAVAVSVIMSWQTTHGGRRSPYGAEVISQTLGFRRFLLHMNENHVQQMMRRDPQYFYKILPYAQAMGLGGRFVALFHDQRLEPCQWYESARGTPTTATAFYERYLDALDMLDISLQK